MLYYIYTYKEGTALSKETKLEKKAAKAAKKAEKAEAQQAAAYAKLVEKINKKNAKLEKKAAKKGVPFVPVAIPTQEEAMAQDNGKVKKIILMIILILLIWYLIYFFVMWFQYEAPIKDVDTTTETVVYDRYSNPHEITTTPDYSPAEAKVYLKQVLHDQWQDAGLSSDPSNGSISYTSNVVDVNNKECYVFSAAGRSWFVSKKLSGVFYLDNGEYMPLDFESTGYLFNE